jgi:hypothetical protein
MACEERSRLLTAYLNAIGKINEAAGTITDPKSPKWKEATWNARMECKKALLAFVQHQREHGCREE